MLKSGLEKMNLFAAPVIAFRIVFAGIGLMFIIVYAFFFKERDYYQTNKINCIKLKNESFSAVVNEAFIDHSNRGIFTIILFSSGDERVYNNLCLINPEAYIEPGDSIYKVKGEFTYYLFKASDHDRRMVLTCDENFDCDYWDGDR